MSNGECIQKYNIQELEFITNRSYGGDCFVLETLLMLVMKQQEAHDLAGKLVLKFGSAKAVFEARYEVLIRFEGINDSVATLLRLVPLLMRRYCMDQCDVTATTFDCMKKMADYCIARYIGTTDEALSILIMDKNYKFLGFEIVQTGSLSRAAVNEERIAELLIAHNAKYFILAHNHPSGDLSPSIDDITTTHDLHRMFKYVGIQMVDHFIIYGKRYVPILEKSLAYANGADDWESY